MSKNQRVINLAGHTLTPYFQYITKVDMRTSPVDKLGNKRLFHLYQKFQGWDPKLAQNDLKIKFEEDTGVATAYFDIHYKNGWKNRYSLYDMSLVEIEESLEDYCDYVHDDMCHKCEDEDYDINLYKF